MANQFAGTTLECSIQIDDSKFHDLNSWIGGAIYLYEIKHVII